MTCYRCHRELSARTVVMRGNEKYCKRCNSKMRPFVKKFDTPRCDCGSVAITRLCNANICARCLKLADFCANTNLIKRHKHARLPVNHPRRVDAMPADAYRVMIQS